MSDVGNDWKDNGRPTSMAAKRFSLLLDSSFGLDEYSETVQKKKEEVATRAAELEELQAKLAAMEERLNPVNKNAHLAPAATSSHHSRSPSGTFRPYLRGPIAGSVRPETPQTEKSSELASKREDVTTSRAVDFEEPVNPKRVISQRRQQRRPDPEEDDDDSEEEDEDSDGSEEDEDEDDSETSSSEAPVRRK